MKFSLVTTTMTSAFALMLLAGGANLAIADSNLTDNVQVNDGNVAGNDVNRDSGNSDTTTETDNSVETSQSNNTETTTETDNSVETSQSGNTEGSNNSDASDNSRTNGAEVVDNVQLEESNIAGNDAIDTTNSNNSDASTSQSNNTETTTETTTDASVKAEAQSSGDAAASGGALNWVSQVTEQNLTGSVSGNFEAPGGARDIITGDLFGGSGNYSHFAGVNNQNLNSGFLAVGQNASSINANGAVSMQ